MVRIIDRTVMIAEKVVGKDNPCFIIAEICSNHNKDLTLAKKMIDAASEAKADAVKFQLFKAENHYSKYSPRFSAHDKSPQEVLKDLELPHDWLNELSEYANRRSIVFFSSVTDNDDVDVLSVLNVPAYKLASFEIVDLPLVKYVASKGKPIILATGLANLGEIEEAYNACLEAGNEQVVLLQCDSAYPASPEIMNLRAMATIKAAFPQAIVGLSDHTMGIHISAAAVALGAKVIEKHITLDRKMKGPDHAFSIMPEELANLVGQIRDVELAMGDGRKGLPTKDEMENYHKARRSLHAGRDVKKGERLTRDMLVIKRPGYGIKPKHMDILINRIVNKDVKADEWITWDMI